MLATLLERPGRIITREELRQRVWPAETFVEFEHGLNTAVKKLRAAFEDSADRPEYIETVPRKGYRLVAKIESQIREDAATGELFSVPGALRIRRLLAFALLLALALISTLFLAWERWKAAKVEHSIRSIAVLPLLNVSGDPAQEYFADGLTDELITALAKAGSFRVISHTSVRRFKGSSKPVAEIARELNVDAVVEGSVVHAGNRVHIAVQLIHASSDRHLWAETYDDSTSEVFGWQTRTAGQIAEQVRARVVVPESHSAVRPDPVAYDEYLRARYLWHQRTDEGLKEAIRLLEDVVRRAPHYADAHAALADAYNIAVSFELMLPRDGSPRARQAAMRALELDPALPAAHAALGYYKLEHEWDWQGATEELQKAIALGPGYPSAHHWLGLFLVYQGKTSEGLAHMRMAIQLDPLSPYLSFVMSKLLHVAGQDDLAIEQCHKTESLDPVFAGPHYIMAEIYEARQLYEKATEERARALQLEGEDDNARAILSAYAKHGRDGYLRELLSSRFSGAQRPSESYDRVIALAQLGEDSRAISLLGELLLNHDRDLFWICREPALGRFHNSSRFRQIAAQVGLPADCAQR